MIYNRVYTGQKVYTEDHRPKRVLNFLEELKAVCKKYGLWIGQEDSIGDFEVYDIEDEADTDWLMDANYIGKGEEP